jgi:hypothetical protein
MRQYPQIGRIQYAPTFKHSRRAGAILQILLILLIGVQTIFADTLYLKDGSEIKDAKIVKIGVSEVEYKIGKKEVLYTAKKSDIAIIFYADGTKETFKDEGTPQSQAPQNINQNVNQNNNQNVNVIVGGQAAPKEPAPTRCGFTANERWGTWFLNWIPGLGSIAIMDDWTGAIVQWGLVGGGIGLFVIGSEDGQYSTDGTYHHGTLYGDFSKTSITLATVGVVVWNTYRSYTYCKPGSVACGSNGGFNISVLPTRHGSLLPAVTYSKSF